MIWYVLGVAFLASGVVFALIGSIGVIRMPDFYSRTHAASKLDTLALGLSMIGMVFFNGADLNGVKLLLIVVFVALANPAAANALGRAAVRARLEPWVRRRPASGTEDAA
ncbi:monovalent cation/H(+) antiporter subunit G [Candidatus Binatia bacterium]|nr:monovalent cation/H(+) antiporter subunit G [Candidatus Binatia bacterium]